MAQAAHLVLADGTVYTGVSFGAVGTSFGEVVFNTGMTGYQEILTDPSYAGQLVTLTYPLIGNYGITPDDFESRRVQVAGFIIKELADFPSNWRSQGTLDGFLKDNGIVGIRGLDTRDLTKKLRSVGVMMGVISSEWTPDELKRKLADAADYSQILYTRVVTTPERYVWKSATGQTRCKVAVLDYGVKYNILRSFAKLGVETTVFPAYSSADEILATDPDGIFLSPGPGDPALLTDIVDTVRTLSQVKPTMGICMGNQLLGCAYGGRTFKLPFGHRGANHPVQEVDTGRVVITSQNHGYALADDFEDPDIEVWQINLNDCTVEGLRHRRLPIFSIQYHPEASPGPRDSGGYFEKFIEMIESTRSLVVA